MVLPVISGDCADDRALHIQRRKQSERAQLVRVEARRRAPTALQLTAVLTSYQELVEPASSCIF